MANIHDVRTARLRANWMERHELKDVLEQHGFAVYDSESTDDLRDAIVDNVEDDTIGLDELPETHVEMM